MVTQEVWEYKQDASAPKPPIYVYNLSDYPL